MHVTPRFVAASVAALTAVAVQTSGSPAASVQVSGGPGAAASPVSVTQLPPPMVSLIFSRSAMGNAINCVPDRSAGTIWMDTTVAPELARRGLTPVGTIETRTIGETTRPCYHYKRTIGMSWQDAAYYRDTFNWTFLSHGRTRVELPTLTDAQVVQQVAGSLQDLRDHGHLRASGMYAYQNNKYTDHAQTIVRRYYDFGRTYKQPATSAVNTHANVDPQRYQWTAALGGGRCRQPVAACTSNVYTNVTYRDPAVHIKAITSLAPGQWLSIQSYAFVDGYRAGQWDCRATDSRLHWTFDGERYCWKDYLKVLDALTSRPGVMVTDPYAVARAWYPAAAPTTAAQR
jgi:hypothetical protein